MYASAFFMIIAVREEDISLCVRRSSAFPKIHSHPDDVFELCIMEYLGVVVSKDE